MRKVQQLHLYLGTLFAPLIIFFALTGALQTLGLHEGERGSSPGLIAKMAEVHIHQRLAASEPERPDAAPGAQATRAKPAEDDAEGKPEGGARRAPSWPFKWFSVLMSVGLIVTTGLGIWMAFKYSRDKRVVWALLAAGIILPILMLLL